MPSPPRRVTGAFHRWDDVRTARCPAVEDGTVQNDTAQCQSASQAAGDRRGVLGSGSHDHALQSLIDATIHESRVQCHHDKGTSSSYPKGGSKNIIKIMNWYS
jgi:hypothetical protein